MLDIFPLDLVTLTWITPYPDCTGLPDFVTELELDELELLGFGTGATLVDLGVETSAGAAELAAGVEAADVASGVEVAAAAVGEAGTV
jgi:hypothetical protein